MSLNGLDSTSILEAYHSALVEGGAWFLIKYTTRDEVDLLGKGSGGLVEVNETVKQYGEQSPLYGFINYRRRKVVLKYIPEGTSRLLQARVTVHFQSIVEKFTPHDTVFSFINHTELRDSKLSSACSLHTASASVKSSTDSLRPPALSEIAEDAQETQPEPPDDRDKRDTEPSLAGEPHKALAAVSKYSDNQDFTRVPSTRRTLSPAHSTRTVRNTDKALPPTPPEVEYKKDYSKSNYEGEQPDDRPSLDARFSFHSIRPPTRDYQSVYEYKPKIKLGPRPSTDSASRSHTSDSPRPVSTLPSSVRVSTRKAASMKPKSRHQQQSSHEMAHAKLALSPPLPIMPIQTPDPFHPIFNGSITPTKSIQPKSPAITPEKRRLMKALQLRQKQLAAQALKLKFSIDPSPEESEFRKRDTIVKTTVDTVEESNEFRKSETARSESWEESEIVQVFIDDSTKSNSNIESSPISILEPSDGQSTQASSITDEEISKVGSNTLDWVSADQAAGNDKILSHPPMSDIHVELNHPHILASFSPVEPNATFTELLDPGAVPLPAVDENEIQDLRSPRNSLGEELQPESSFQSVSENQPQEQKIGLSLNVDDEDLNTTRPSTSGTSHQGGFGENFAGHDKPVLLQRTSTPENSEDHFLSDDSFMEELRSATVQEAKPISVSLSKSPIAPVFPRRSSDHRLNEGGNNTRSVSNPVGHIRTENQMDVSPQDPPHLSSRSFSASHHSGNVQPQQASAIMLKKIGVSSGISQRIKALEQLSSRPTSPSSQGQPTINAAGPSPAFVSFRKVTLKSPPQPKTDSSEGMGSKIRQKISSPAISPSFGAAYPNLEGKSRNMQVESKPKKSQPDSISVTATIIRDSDTNITELCRSPLVVEHQSGTKASTPSSPLKPPRSRFASPRSVSSSSTERRSETPQATRRDSLASKRSVTSARGGSEVDLSRSISDTSVNGVNGYDGSKEEKKESRKNRLFKRMSGISSASRRSIVQALNPSMKEGPIVEHYETVYEAPKVMAAFGDVNVQFPDTLLWKRRDMKINIQGNLVLSQSKADNNSKVVTKQYPLSEFYPPYIPDQDRQELPNSVILDFKDGSTLQTACENLKAQEELLKALRHAQEIYNPQ